MASIHKTGNPYQMAWLCPLDTKLCSCENRNLIAHCSKSGWLFGSKSVKFKPKGIVRCLCNVTQKTESFIFYVSIISFAVHKTDAGWMLVTLS